MISYCLFLLFLITSSIPENERINNCTAKVDKHTYIWWPVSHSHEIHRKCRGGFLLTINSAGVWETQKRVSPPKEPIKASTHHPGSNQQPTAFIQPLCCLSSDPLGRKSCTDHTASTCCQLHSSKRVVLVCKLNRSRCRPRGSKSLQCSWTHRTDLFPNSSESPQTLQTSNGWPSVFQDLECPTSKQSLIYGL